MYQIDSNRNRLGDKKCCWLCDKSANDPTTTFEDHHILPKHLGGEKGPLVFLCSDCHTNVHKCAEKLLKGNKWIPYKNKVHIDKCLYLANVIVKATLLIESNSENKIYVYSGTFDYSTHEMLVALVKYFKNNKTKMNQDTIIKQAIREMYQKYL